MWEGRTGLEGDRLRQFTVHSMVKNYTQKRGGTLGIIEGGQVELQFPRVRETS